MILMLPFLLRNVLLIVPIILSGSFDGSECYQHSEDEQQIVASPYGD